MRKHLVCFVLAGSACVAVAAPEYSAVELTPLAGYDYTYVSSVSANGIATGYCYTNGGQFQGFTWQNGVMTGLGYDTGFVNSMAYAVNSAGVVAMASYDTTFTSFVSYTLSGGVKTYLNPLDPGVPVTPTAINEAGQVVGYTDDNKSVVWTGGVPTLLALAPGMVSSYASVINNSGDVAGSFIDGSHGHAAAWFGGTPVDLGVGAGGDPRDSASAIGMNDNGVIVGQSVNYEAASFGTHAVVWQGGTMTDLTPGPASSAATSINNAGDILGRTYNDMWLLHDGVFYDMTALIGADGANWELYDPRTISNGGFIAANGYHNGATSAVILVPVPEPATLAALGLGVLALRRRKRTQ